MHTPSHRVVGLVAALLAAAALGFALASEQWWGLVPCALCLVERWPLRIVIVLGLLAVIVPPGIGRFVLMLIVLTLLADAVVAAVHVGVEFHWWPSPLPECAAPKFSGGSITQRLASMPLRPAKPCDSPTYLIPFLPVSMAAMNLGFSLVFARWRGCLDRPPTAPEAAPMTAQLPGDRPAQAQRARMIRVDHAGEYGAARIYAGQLAILGRGDRGDVLRHMQAQEQAHLDTFNRMVARDRVRPTALLPFWYLAGFALGAATAALGEKAAMACTVAVEEAIDAHYSAQIDTLDEPADAPLRATLEAFRDEEREHRDIGLAHGAEQAPGYRLLSRAIKAGCRIAIALSERVAAAARVSPDRGCSTSSPATGDIHDYRAGLRQDVCAAALCPSWLACLTGVAGRDKRRRKSAGSGS